MKVFTTRTMTRAFRLYTNQKQDRFQQWGTVRKLLKRFGYGQYDERVELTFGKYNLIVIIRHNEQHSTYINMPIRE